MWNFVRGFLPDNDPAEVLMVRGETYRRLVQSVENLAATLTPNLYNRTVREEIVCQLRDVVPLFDHDLFNSFGSDKIDERAFLLYGYFAAAFVNNHGDKPLHRLAKEITIPLVRLAERVQRKPLLDYYSYIMYNWRRKDASGPLSVENLEPLLTFSGTDDEKNYIVTHVAAEALVVPFINTRTLEVLSAQLSKMLVVLQNTKLPRMVESYFQTFTKVKYEGWGWPDPQTYNGEVATQSTTISFVARMLGLPYQDGDIRDYKPIGHRHFLDGVHSLRSTENKTLYNECLSKFVEVADAITSPQNSSMWKRFGGDKEKFLAEYTLGVN